MSDHIHCLRIDRTATYVGGMDGAFALLEVLQQSLPTDIDILNATIAQADLIGAQHVLHQLKGFAPVVCGDDLVDLIHEAEALSLGKDAHALQRQWTVLVPKLQQLQDEVNACMAQRP